MATRKPLIAPKVVAYIGLSDVRELSEEDWYQINIKCESRSWSARNLWQIPIDRFSDDALTWLDSQPDFAIIDVAIKSEG